MIGSQNKNDGADLKAGVFAAACLTSVRKVTSTGTHKRLCSRLCTVVDAGMRCTFEV